MALPARLFAGLACAAIASAACWPSAHTTSSGASERDGAEEPVAAGTGSERSEPRGGLPSAPSGRVDPDPVDARVATIEAALGAGDFAGARSIAEAVLADHPRHGLARLLLGVALNKLLLYQRARPELEAVVRGGPTFEKYDETWYFLGWALFNSGELALARDAFEKHLERRPNEGDSHFALGLIDLEDGDEEGALGRFQRSIELNRAAVDAGNKGRLPDVAKAHARIADIYLARDEVEAAVEELERCVTLWPAHYNAWFKLHRAHTLLGNDELAAASMRQHDHWKAQAQGAKTP